LADRSALSRLLSQAAWQPRTDGACHRHSKPHAYARPILERFDLARRFAGIVGPELDGTNDHKGDLIAHIVAREGVVPERAVMIGDRAVDVAAAKRNGIPAVGVTWGYGTAGELLEAGASGLCPAPAGLAAMVEGLRDRLGRNGSP
jgi:phosphoglycolate phosphatase